MSATGANSPKLTYDQFKALKRRREVTHPIVTDDDAVTAYKLAAKSLHQAKSRGDADAITAHEEQLAAAETAIRESTVLLRLRALPRDAYAALKAEHPPTDDDHAQVREISGDPKAAAQFHPATFGPALVAACLVEPEVTVEQAGDMYSEMNDAEWSGLLFAARQANELATDTAGLVFS